MKLLPPKLTALTLGKPHIRRPGEAIFVRQHSVKENSSAVEDALKRVLNADPKDWLFLVEGGASYNCPENVLLDQAVSDNGIVVDDPIIKPYSDLMAFEIGIDPKSAALAVLLNDPSGIYNLNLQSLRDDELVEWFDKTTKCLAEMFNIKQSDLIQEYQQLMEQPGSKFCNLDEAIQTLADALQRLIDKSNEKSFVKMGRILLLNKQQKVFVFSGIAHEGVFISES